MKVIYPPLVEQGFNFFKQENPSVTKAEVYKSLVENNILDETGAPTDFALELGWVKEFTEEQNLTFNDFLNIYPIFKHYGEHHFKIIDGFWEIDRKLREKINQQLATDSFDDEEEEQLEAFFSARKEIY
ncbi:hypothetical protein JCM15457_632 [Liquorilactobacillus sucicola DSM 21376 = JCM 15457]|uniref:Uncharacterized protein n=1 Tax=Liquorilactobacillus sucicola DSM 21376 = JCM 15457 TaxID=1423806 RepID=A0A023CVD4_9LACO|nr:hypothetical protein [Liquorilactobacillus sucicola]KRN05668.1 hypothetical protein FD15_GL002232 [Liquorilactobacillus sucicola DSM 21376 = JCM 15457]GAJ25754.1 hypothetical protein JCM15457_632 [Liquorilactobacillus sucicola DSM 21376 = JCM 15457]